MASNNERPSKAERNANARAQAAARQAQLEASQKRKSLMVKLGVLAAVVVVIALVVALIVQNNNGKIAEEGAIPSGGTNGGGILVTSATTLGGTGSGMVKASAEDPESPKDPADPRDLVVGKKGEPVNITMYVDVNCIHCAEFEAKYGEQINNWLADGKVTVEYRNVGFLDRGSPTNYSSRGANALACVADKSPESYTKFVSAIWGHYSQGEMKNSELIKMAHDSGASDAVDSCINKGDFRPFVAYATAAAQADGVRGTPSIYIQGKEFQLGTDDFVTEVEAAIKANA
ncbi:DsbA family protein [Glutamicibacter endophyticus]|uniref:DsbA family protein n=1 Tax=Glutamicibacter endophyticus TaxID=1522174 RepID=UPI003AF1C3FE